MQFRSAAHALAKDCTDHGLRKLPAQVNASLAAKVLAEQGGGDKQGEPEQDAAGGKRQKRPAADLLQDERFAALFEDKAFAIDEKSEEYRALHPNAGADMQCLLLPVPRACRY